MPRKIATHGGYKSPIYWAWLAMIDRCHKPGNPQFKNYGARGILVCARWRKSFVLFRNDMGPRPSDLHSIDRIENNRGYSPENCRWATQKEQCNNKRTNTYFSAHGKTLTIAQWADQSGIKQGTLLYRIKVGKSAVDVFRKTHLGNKEPFHQKKGRKK